MDEITQPPCESIVETIQRLKQDLYTVEDQLQVLSVEGVEEQHPQGYIDLQRQINHLVKKRLELQDALNQAMDELVRCKSDS